LFSDELMDYVKNIQFQGIYCDKVFYLKKWYTILSKDKESCSEPSFKNTSQSKVGSKL